MGSPFHLLCVGCDEVPVRILNSLSLQSDVLKASTFLGSNVNHQLFKHKKPDTTEESGLQAN